MRLGLRGYNTFFPVFRLGGERICLAFPSQIGWRQVEQVTGRNGGEVRAGDDAQDGMPWYDKGGAVITLCGDFALYDLLSKEDGDLTLTCLGCIANRGKL